MSKVKGMGKIFVGTASWSDPGFVADWYPPKLPPAERLTWYAEHFEMVEVNSTFYAVPQPALVRRWCDATPEHFVFNVKLHQALSRHAAQAKMLPPVLRRQLEPSTKVEVTEDLETELAKFLLPSLEVLRRAGKLGVLLLQLSPAFSPHRHALRELDHLFALLGANPVAVELRNREWVATERLEETAAFFRKRQLIFVAVDAPRSDHFTIMPSDLELVTNQTTAYLRLHGRDPDAYLKGKSVAARFNYNYDEEEIEGIAHRARSLAKEVESVHVVFNNNARDYAPHAASRLRKALGQLTTIPPRTGELL